MKILLTIIFTGLFSNVISQESLSLNDALKRALENNFSIKISDNDLSVAEKNNSWGRAGFLPQINIGASLGYSNIDVYDPATDSRSKNTVKPFNPDIYLSWTFFDGFASNYRKKEYSLLHNLAKLQLAQDMEGVIKQTISIYYKCVLEKQKLNVFNDYMVLSRDKYHYVMNQKKMGVKVTFDVLQEKNSYLQDSSNYIMQKINYENALRDLNAIFSSPENVDFTVTDTLVVSENNFIEDGLNSKMLSDNISIKKLRTNQKRLENNIRLNKSAFLPKVSLRTGYMISDADVSTENDNRNTMYATLNFQLNLYNGGNNRRNVNVAKLKKESGILQIQDMEISLGNTLMSLLEQYRLNRQILEVSMEGLNSSRINMEIAEGKYKNGTINSFNFRTIREAYLNASLNVLQSKYNIIVSEVNIKQLTGELLKLRK